MQAIEKNPDSRKLWNAGLVSVALHGLLLAGLGLSFDASLISEPESSEAASRPVLQAHLVTDASASPASKTAAPAPAPTPPQAAAPSPPPPETPKASPQSVPAPAPAPASIPAAAAAPPAQPSATPPPRPADMASALPPAPAYRGEGLDPPPRPVSDIDPEYPTEAGLQEGTVVLRILIDASGKVDNVAVVRSNPRGVFDQSALAAFGNAKFSPGYFLGVPVKSQITIAVDYTPTNRGNAVSGAR